MARERSPKDTFITVYGRKPVLEALGDRSLRVDKVVLGARAIIANGGVITDAGAAAIARAAKEQGNAVIVLSGVYKLSTELPSDESSVIEWSNPSNFVDFANGAMVSGVKVRSAVTELIPPEFIDTYITNL